MYGNNFGYPFMGGMPNQIVPPMTGNMMGTMIGAPKVWRWWSSIVSRPREDANRHQWF